MKPSVEHLFPIIVLYKAQLNECSSYITFLKDSEIREFMVYDNSPNYFKGQDEQLDARAVYIRDTSNSGLSKAYNTAARYASEKGYQRLLLLDQDTSFPPNAIQCYLEADANVSLWAPCLVSGANLPFSPVRVNGFTLKATPTQPGLHSLYHLNPVNSGMCIQLAAFMQAQGYNERVKLDYADFEFCKRLRRLHPLFQVIPLTLTQDFSNDNPSVTALISRHRLYVESAAHCQHDSLIAWLRHQYQVGKHSLALFLKTHSLRIVSQYFRHFIFARL